MPCQFTGSLLQQLREQVELLLEQLLVLAQVEAEQREGFRERAAAEDHLGAAIGYGIEGRKALEHTNRIVGAQHRHRRTEPDSPGTSRNCRQHHLGRGDREVGAVVFAEADEVDPKLVGQHRLFDEVADHLRVRQRRAAGVIGNVAKGIEPKFERCRHVSYPILAGLGASRRDCANLSQGEGPDHHATSEARMAAGTFSDIRQLAAVRPSAIPRSETHGFRFCSLAGGALISLIGPPARVIACKSAAVGICTHRTHGHQIKSSEEHQAPRCVNLAFCGAAVSRKAAPSRCCESARARAPMPSPTSPSLVHPGRYCRGRDKEKSPGL